jgi:hypothetical protein
MKMFGNIPHTAGHVGMGGGDIRYIPRLSGIDIHALIVEIQENSNQSPILYNFLKIKEL